MVFCGMRSLMEGGSLRSNSVSTFMVAFFAKDLPTIRKKKDGMNNQWRGKSLSCFRVNLAVSLQVSHIHMSL